MRDQGSSASLIELALIIVLIAIIVMAILLIMGDDLRLWVVNTLRGFSQAAVDRAMSQGRATGGVLERLQAAGEPFVGPRLSAPVSRLRRVGQLFCADCRALVRRILVRFALRCGGR